MVTARRCANGPAVLLRTGDPVRKTKVRCAVDSYDRPLIAADNHSFRIVGINPELVIIVTAGRAFDGRPSLSAISRPIHRSIHHVNHVRIFRVGSDLLEIPAAIPQSLLARERLWD